MKEATTYRSHPMLQSDHRSLSAMSANVKAQLSAALANWRYSAHERREPWTCILAGGYAGRLSAGKPMRDALSALPATIHHVCICYGSPTMAGSTRSGYPGGHGRRSSSDPRSHRLFHHRRCRSGGWPIRQFHHRRDHRLHGRTSCHDLGGNGGHGPAHGRFGS